MVSSTTSTQAQGHFCQTCSKSFMCAPTLRTCKDSVHNKKQHKCFICGDTFGYANTLQRHLKKQQKGRPYPANSADVTHRSTSVSSRDPFQAISGQMVSSPNCQLIQTVPPSTNGLQATQQVTNPCTQNEQTR